VGQSDGRSSALRLARLGQATRYSLQGLRAAYHHEAAFRQELALAALLIPLALALAAWSPLTWTQCALLVGSVLLILLVEMLNSAVESVVDRISEQHHALSKRAKDTGSAAVFIALINCGVVWALVLVDVFVR
jgi:diacylglycerol kinase (ATP)